MSTRIMAECWPLQMPASAKAVLISLADNSNDQGHCWPSIAQIAERTCLHRTAVMRAIGWLESSGVVTAVKTRGIASSYDIRPAEFVQPASESALATEDDSDQSRRATGSVGRPVAQSNQSRRATSRAEQPVAQSDQSRRATDQSRRATRNRQEPSNTKRKTLPKKEGSKEKNRDAISLANLPDGITPELAAELIAYRKCVKAPLTQRAFDSLIAKLARTPEIGLTPEEALTAMQEAGWRGLELAWLENRKCRRIANGANRKLSVVEEVEQAIRERRAREATHTPRGAANGPGG